MGLIERVANVIHKNQGWYVSDSFTDAPLGSWGTRDGDLFEKLGMLKDVNMGVPDPISHSIVRTPRWFVDSGVTVGAFNVHGKAPSADVAIDVKITFSSQYSVACFLSEYTEVQMDNTDPVGDALVALYRRSGTDWRLSKKWVYTSLKVVSGFIVMSRERNTSVTLSGRGTVNASGVPIKINADGFVNSASASVETIGLENITPFVKLCEVYDPLFAAADWRQMG